MSRRSCRDCVQVAEWLDDLNGGRAGEAGAAELAVALACWAVGHLAEHHRNDTRHTVAAAPAAEEEQAP